MLKGIASWRTSRAGVVVASLLLTVVLACVANLTLDVWHVGGLTPRSVGTPVAERLALFLLGSLVVWLFVVVLVAVSGRLWLSVGVVATLTVLLGFANYRKQQMLMEPLYPSDLTYALDPGFLADMVGYDVLLMLLALSATVLTAALLAGQQLGRWFPRPDRRAAPRVGWALAGIRLAGAAAGLAGIAYLTHFHDPGNLLKVTYDDNGAHWRPWHQSANYATNGFVAGMLYNLPMPAMPRPADYGPATMRALVTKYSGVAAGINRSRDPAALGDVNVLFLLGESFSDPTRAKTAELEADPIPYTRSLMQRTTSGSMWSPQYGGGTANVEFEALTGMSLAQLRPQMTTPFQMLVPNYDEFPSSVDVLEQHGLTTLAMHSFTSALYRRAEVYPALGFQDSVFQDEMTHTATLEDNSFISDQATYAEVLTRLQSADEPMFLNVVTMQNHYPMAGRYDHPIKATGLSDAEATSNLEHYARGLLYSDAAMRHLIDTLEKSREKTVVVFFGDHLPPLWPPPAMTRRTAHETPFFLYSNFAESRAERLPTTSPIYFMNHVLELTDASVSPYHALLQRLEQQIPAMGRGMMIGPDNQKLSSDELPAPARRLLRDYRLVQYDLSVGQRYSPDMMLDQGLIDKKTNDASRTR